MWRITRRCDAATLGKDLTGLTYVVTGANSGIGLETTRQIVKQGGHVVMACRRVEAAQEVAKEFADLKGSWEVIRCDLADLASVRDFVATFEARHQKLQGLLCNAGMIVMGKAPKMSKDGIELTLATGLAGHFLMTELLLDRLIASAPARVGILSSVMHVGRPGKRFRVHIDDLNWQARPYRGTVVYSEAKVAANLYALELAERLQGKGVSTAAIHPGWARSNFGGHGFWMRLFRILIWPFRKWLTDSNEDAAQTSLHVLLSDDAPNHSGAYFSQSSVLYRDPGTWNGGWPLETPNPHARDMDDARALVSALRKMVGLDPA